MKSTLTRLLGTLTVVAGLGFAASSANALTITDPGAANATSYVARNNDLGLAGGTNQTVLVGYALQALGPGTLSTSTSARKRATRTA